MFQLQCWWVRPPLHMKIMRRIRRLNVYDTTKHKSATSVTLIELLSLSLLPPSGHCQHLPLTATGSISPWWRGTALGAALINDQSGPCVTAAVSAISQGPVGNMISLPNHRLSIGGLNAVSCSHIKGIAHSVGLK